MFCPTCGEEKEKNVGKICLECFISDKELIKIPDYLDVEFCVKCESFKEKGEWREPQQNPKLEAAESAVMSSLGVHKKVKNPRITLDPEVGGDQINFDIEVFGEIENEPILLNTSTKVRLDKKTCKRCSKIAGGYFESIIQIRGKGRELTKEEIKEIKERIFSLSERTSETKRMAFIGEIKEVDGGLDVFAGTSDLGQKIAKAIIDDFGGSYSQSSSLIGMSDGQEVHRVTYSVRLPSFKEGDIIRVNEDLIGIQDVGKTINGIKLDTGENFRRNWKHLKNKDIEKVGEKKEIKKGTVSLVTKKEAQIIDPWNYENVVLKKPDFLGKRDEGKKIPVLKHNKEIFLLPKTFG